MSGSPFLKTGTYYRAEVRQGKHVVAQLKGRYNGQEALDKFLAEHWPYERVWQNIPDSYKPLVITIWKYMGSQGKVWARWSTVVKEEIKL